MTRSCRSCIGRVAVVACLFALPAVRCLGGGGNDPGQGGGDADGVCERVSSLPPAEACAWAQEHCEEEALVPYLRLYHCHVAGLPWAASAAVVLLLLAELVLLFVVLGNTAEDFLSPALTQLSQEMGLPPRFAGVTFLALGNGAADLSSSIAAVKAGNYEMALGAQVGSGCFVGCIVAGLILLQGAGVRARGALVRDVCAYAISLLVVAAVIAAGTFAFWSCLLLLCMYGAYVLSVLGADVWHRTSKRWKAGRGEPLARPLLGSERSQQTPFSEPPLVPFGDTPPGSSTASEEGSGSGTGSSDDDDDDKGGDGGALDGGDGVGGGGDKPLSRQQLMAMSGREYTLRAWAAVARSGSFRRLSSLIGSRGSREAEERHRGHGHGGRNSSSGGGSSRTSSSGGNSNAAMAGGRSSRSSTPAGLPPMVPEEGVAAIELQSSLIMSSIPSASAAADGSKQLPGGGAGDVEAAGSLPSTPPPAAATGRAQWQHTPPPQPPPRASAAPSAALREELQQKRWVQLLTSTAAALAAPVARVARPLLAAAELPFNLALRATVPLVAPESYERHWFLVAVALSPAFLALYLRKLTLWWLVGAACLGALLCALAWLGVRGSDPEEPPFWGFGTSFPIGAATVAVYGFLVAAAWVDSLATELVGLLGFLGALLRVDHTVLGLTVLAWGNSVGDLSSNLAMARRGLSNMAITACFAGPLFNTLVGMGAGFIAYFGRVGAWTVPVALPAAVLPGIALALLNCCGMLAAGVLLGRGHVPRAYGWACLALYCAYVAAAVAMAAVAR